MQCSRPWKEMRGGASASAWIWRFASRLHSVDCDMLIVYAVIIDSNGSNCQFLFVLNGVPLTRFGAYARHMST